VALILFMYIVFVFITQGLDPSDPNAPLNVLIASDHAAYIGIVTNIVLGLLTVLLLRSDRRSWIGQVIFWGVNLGLLVFVIGLIVNTAQIKQIGAPVMGITLLLALAILAYTALREPLEASEADLDRGV